MGKPHITEHVIVTDRLAPSCHPDNHPCDAQENPSHWVDIELTPEAARAVRMFPQLTEALDRALNHIKAKNEDYDLFGPYTDGKALLKRTRRKLRT